MVRLIIGKNAAGKTLYLENMIKRYELFEVNTNMRDKIYTYQIPYNKKRIEILKECLETEDISENSLSLGIANSTAYMISTELLELLTLICRDRNILILDEPLKKLSAYEYEVFIKVIAWVQDTYTDIYIVTHNELALAIPGKQCYTVEMDQETNHVRLIEIAKENELEVID